MKLMICLKTTKASGQKLQDNYKYVFEKLKGTLQYWSNLFFLEEPNAAFEELNEIEYMYVLEEESKEYIDKIEVVDEMSITLSIKKIPLRMKLRS